MDPTVSWCRWSSPLSRELQVKLSEQILFSSKQNSIVLFNFPLLSVRIICHVTLKTFVLGRLQFGLLDISPLPINHNQNVILCLKLHSPFFFSGSILEFQHQEHYHFSAQFVTIGFWQLENTERQYIPLYNLGIASLTLSYLSLNDRHLKIIRKVDLVFGKFWNIRR